MFKFNLHVCNNYYILCASEGSIQDLKLGEGGGEGAGVEVEGVVGTRGVAKAF